MHKLFLTVTTGLLFASGITAQTDTTTRLLDDVIITAQRYAEKSLNIPYSTQSVSRSYMDNYQPRTAPEALTGVNGVFIQKTNHGGGSPFLRGLTGNQTLILVDGIRLNNSTFRYGPNQYLNTIDQFTINKIEVVKGTGSVQYGSDALGGVVQIFTKDPTFNNQRGQWSGELTGKYMTGGMEKTLRGESSYSSEKVAATIGATYRNFGDLIGGDTTGKQSPSGYKEFAFDVKSKFLLKPSVELTLAHQFLQQQNVPLYHRVVLENYALSNFDPQQRMLSYARLQVGNNNPIVNKINIIASWQQNIEGRNNRRNGSTVLRKEKDQTNTLGFTVDMASRFTDVWTANSGIELYHDKVNSSRQDQNTQTLASTMLRGLYPDDSRYGNYSLYSLHHFNLNRWVVESGVRYNTFAISISDTTLGKVKISPASFVYNASLLYKINNRQTAYVTFNTGYRAPNVDDMGTLGIVDFRYEKPTSNLEPERSVNIEAGYKLQSNKWSATFSGFYMHLNNLITRVKVEGQRINGYDVYQKENVEEGYIKGIEATVDYSPFKGWLIKGSAAYAQGQSLTRSEPLRRIPPFNGRLLSSYEKNKWFASAELLFASTQDRLAQGDKDDNRIPRGGTPGFSVINLYTGYEIAMLKLNIGLQNLMNTDYRTHGSGINGAGRSGWLSVQFRF